MPGVYKEKECPVCGIIHRKRGLYCCQTCANSTRIHSEETKQKISESNKEASQSPERIAHGHMLKAGTLMAADEYAINIPDLSDRPDLDGYTDASDW